MKTEFSVMRDGKIWFNCYSEAEAIGVAKHYNTNFRDSGTSRYVPCSRQVSEWTKIR